MNLSKGVMIDGRLTYIDVAKGIAILLMLFTHTCTPQTINTLVFGFHMPLFFIVGGILLYTKYGIHMSVEQFKGKLAKRLFTLGVPYIVFGFLLSCFYLLLAGLSDERNGKEIFFRHLVSIITLKGVDSMWFLPCYFFSEIFTCFLMRLKSFFTVGGVLCSLVVLSVILHLNEYLTSSYTLLIFKFFVCYSFFFIGCLISRFRMCEKITKLKAWIILIVVSVLSLLNGFVAIGALIFNNGVLFYLVAILTTMSLFAICEFKGMAFGMLSFWGQNTLVVVCTNNLLIELIRLIDYKLLGNSLMNIGLFGNFLFTALLLLLEIPIIRASRGSLSILFGRKTIA